MAPKVVAKAKKPPPPILEPEDKNSAPDLAALMPDLRGSDAEAQQQALARLFALREYPGAKVAVQSA